MSETSEQSAPAPNPPGAPPFPRPAPPVPGVPLSRPPMPTPPGATNGNGKAELPPIEDEEFAPDSMPLLPRGGAIFEDIPAKAVVLEELAPALVNGALVVRRSNGVGIVLVKDSALWERFCFHDMTAPKYGDEAMAEIRLWLDATISAFRMKPDVVELSPALLRGDFVYQNMHLSWMNWRTFIADLKRRTGTFVVELRTNTGRGVTCIRDGQQIATFTSGHPEFGEPTLLDELAASGRGSISVRSEPKEQVPVAVTSGTVAAPPAASAAADAPAAPVVPTPAVAGEAAEVGDGYDFQPVTTNGNGGGDAENPFGPIFGDSNFSAADGHDPIDVSVASVLPQLKEIAQDRLRRSSSRVEAMLDEAAAADKPLDTVLDEIRGLVIRGVMQSTLDSVVDEMMSAASRIGSAH